jgi:hypothetical protein
VPYFGIPYGKRTYYGKRAIQPAIAGVAAPGGVGNVNIVIAAFPGIDGTFPDDLSLKSFNYIGNGHDVKPNIVSDLYLSRASNGAGNHQTIQVVQGADIRAHCVYVQFPEALPVDFEIFAAGGRNFECRVLSGVAPAAQYVMRALQPNIVAPAARVAENQNWTILGAATVPTLAVFNAAHPGRPDAPARGVIKLWVQFMAADVGNPAPIALPQNDGFGTVAGQDFFDAIAGYPNEIVGARIQGQTAIDTPYIRSGFSISFHEPFFNFPSGFSSYPKMKEPFDEILAEYPLIIQDSLTLFTRSTSELSRCIRIDTGTLTASLVGEPVLGIYLRDGALQANKRVSTIEMPLPLFEKQNVSFTTGTPALSWSTHRGVPDYFFIRVAHEVTGALPIEDYHAKIQKIRIKCFDNQQNTILKTVKYEQLRELTRRNSHMYSEPQQNTVLISAEQLAGFEVNPDERLDLKIELLEYTEHTDLAGSMKQFICCPIYRNLLQGDNLSLRLLNR